MEYGVGGLFLRHNLHIDTLVTPMRTPELRRTARILAGEEDERVPRRKPMHYYPLHPSLVEEFLAVGVTEHGSGAV